MTSETPTTNPPHESDASDSRLRLALPLALVWVAVVSLLFYTSTMPNSGLSRFAIWPIRPEILSLVFSKNPSASLAGLLERFPFWLLASGVVLAAISIGDLILSRLKASCDLSWPERVGLAGGLGLSVWSLITLSLGVVGALWRALFVVAMLIAIGSFIYRHGRSRAKWMSSLRSFRPSYWHSTTLAVVAPFAVFILLGASLPSVDFDVREYHIQGPKEFFEAGRISFLEHNVYTSFPFLTEMLTLSGMVLTGDPRDGVILGKVILASFAGFAALLVWSLGKRVGPWVACVAVIAWLTSPWCYRASIIAYTEGALSYYVTAVFATGWIAWEKRSTRWWLVCGLLAGSAMACKYPGLVQAVVPAGLVSIVAVWRQRSAAEKPLSWTAPVWFSLGVLVTFGPWSLKNFVETGNPVYPLGYSVFGGVDLDDAWAEKWRNGHSPPFNVVKEPARAVPDFVASLSDVFILNDWQTPLVATFGPLAVLLLLLKRPPMLVAVSLAVLWLYVMWWALTHRIDRFWVPMLPLACLLAGLGATWPQRVGVESARPIWRIVVIVLVAWSAAFHVPVIASGMSGLNTWLSPYNVVDQVALQSAAGIGLVNENVPPDARVLMVGEAQVFDQVSTPIYNTVFDTSLFQRWTTADLSLPDGDQQLAETNVIRQNFAEQRLTHLFVNWGEVLRYRTTYGYTDFVTPAKINELVARGILKPVRLPPERTHGPWEPLGDSTKQQVESWGPSLKVQLGGSDAIKRYELFEITPFAG